MPKLGFTAANAQEAGIHRHPASLKKEHQGTWGRSLRKNPVSYGGRLLTDSTAVKKKERGVGITQKKTTQRFIYLRKNNIEINKHISKWCIDITLTCFLGVFRHWFCRVLLMEIQRFTDGFKGMKMELHVHPLKWVNKCIQFFPLAKYCVLKVLKICLREMFQLFSPEEKCFVGYWWYTLPETNIAFENRPPNRKVVFQPSIVRGVCC